MKAHLSVPGRIFTSISIYFQDISPFLLLYYLTFKHINKLILIGLFLFTATPILFMFAAGSRGIPVILGFCFIAYYILLHKHIPENRKNVIGIVFLIGAVFVGVIVSYITISRFGDTEFDISEWIYRYIGEPFPDFNCDGFHTRQHTDGYNCFPFFQHLWNPALPDTRNIMHLSHQTGIRMYVYYTFIGDIYIDFGPIFCVLFILALASIMHVFVKRGSGSYSIPAIIIMGLYLKMGIVGYMFMFTKLQPLMIVMTVILALMLNFFNAFEREEEEA
jgi:oligosaccharide repeat unit polymerase